MTTVLIVEDQAAIRSGLRLLLDAEEDIEVVGEAGSANQAVYEAIALEPDVVLMDVAMPEGSGIDAIPKVLEAAPDAKALVLSMEDDPSSAREAFAAGASGYVLTEAADAELVAAVREVAAGGRYVHPALGARLVPADTEERHRAEEDPLSDRERELLRLVALRHTNQEIAQLLFVSVRTAEAQRTRIMEKLRLATQAELVRYALERGLLDEE